MSNVADPLGGAPYVEWMTDEMERQAEAVFAHLDELGNGSILEGVYAGIDNGYFVGEIADAAYRFEAKSTTTSGSSSASTSSPTATRTTRPTCCASTIPSRNSSGNDSKR